MKRQCVAKYGQCFPLLSPTISTPLQKLCGRTSLGVRRRVQSQERLGNLIYPTCIFVPDGKHPENKGTESGCKEPTPVVPNSKVGRSDFNAEENTYGGKEMFSAIHDGSSVSLMHTTSKHLVSISSAITSIYMSRESLWSWGYRDNTTPGFEGEKSGCLHFFKKRVYLTWRLRPQWKWV